MRFDGLLVRRQDGEGLRSVCESGQGRRRARKQTVRHAKVDFSQLFPRRFRRPFSTMSLSYDVRRFIKKLCVSTKHQWLIDDPVKLQ
jgi:hypothetical protein